MWLLGPNGEGKVFINANYFNATKPDSGSIEFDGINVLEDQMGLRKILGYLPQEFGVYPNMSAENYWIILLNQKELLQK
jgi:ABC-type multidrug transport system ATPase subunit